MPSNRPAYSGSARVVASAAPVVVGTRFAAAARPRVSRLFGPSTRDCDAVYACTVVIAAFLKPMRRPMTSTIGVMQLVVQLAHEMTVDEVFPEFTPGMTVSTSPSFDGADSRTVRAPAWMCFSTSPRRLSAPVHSNTSADAELLPGKLQRVAASERSQLAPGDHQIAAVNDHGLVVAPVDRVEAE